MKRLSLAFASCCVVAFTAVAAPIQQLASLPLSFEENCGQADAAVKFIARTHGSAALIVNDGLVLSVGNEERTSVRMRVLGAKNSVAISGEEKLPGTVNYLRRDPAASKTNIATFAKVRSREILPGIDAVFYGRERQLEYDFILRPGTNPEAIQMLVDGVAQITLGESGDLLLHTRDGALKQHAPVAYQIVNGERRLVDVRYVVKNPLERKFSFALGAYDRTRELIIDPVITFGTFLGGSSDDTARAMALDAAGNIYIAGTTVSTDLPTVVFPFFRASYQASLAGSCDVFVTKLSSNGTTVLYTTYLGGTNADYARAIAVDSQGYVSVAGMTFSGDFPITSGAWRTQLHTCAGGFLTRLDAVGHNAIFSTYLTSDNAANDGYCFLVAPINFSWGLADDGVFSLYRDSFGANAGNGVAVDVQNNIYVAGDTARRLFDPIVVLNETPDQNRAGGFVCKFTPNGSILYATYLGGRSNVTINAVAVDANGSAYVTGSTDSSDLPVTRGAAQPTFHRPADAFVAKLDPAGAALEYCTYLGGSFGCDFLLSSALQQFDLSGLGGSETGNAISVASNGVAWVAGATKAQDFPIVGTAIQAALLGTYPIGSIAGGNNSFIGISPDAFVTAVAPDGKSFVYSTLLGGTNNESAFAISAARDGSIVVGGWTTSSNFPTRQAWQPTLRGRRDAFITRFHPTDGLIYSSYLGGNGEEEINALGMDGNGAVIVAGTTFSPDFPVTSGVAYPTFLGGTNDAFVVKIGTTWTLSSLSPSSVIVGSPFFLLSVNGTNFPNDAKVLWGNLEPPIVSSTSTQITVVIYASNLLQSATRVVNVVRPNGTQGDNTLPFLVAPLPGDYFATPLTLAGYSNSVTMTNTFATHELDEPLHAYTSGAHSIWWTWTAPVSGNVEFNTIGSDFDTTLAIYTGSQIEALTRIAWNDDEAPPTIRTSKTQFSAAAGTAYRIAADGWSTANGKLVLNMLMAYPAPTLTGIDQQTALAGATGFPLNIYGSNFVPASRVLVNSAPRPATFLSSTQLLSTIYTSDLGVPGNVFVSVWTPEPGGGTTASATIQVLPAPPAPTLSALKPNTTLAGSETMVVIATGSNFMSNSVVKWNGSARPTTYFSSKQLLFTAMATDLVGISTNNVTVFTPAPGGGTSGAKQFFVTSTNGGTQTLSLKALGYSSEGFAYAVNGEIGSEVVIQSTTNFTQWTSLNTNVLLTAPAQLLDADTNTPAKFLRGVVAE